MKFTTEEKQQFAGMRKAYLEAMQKYVSANFSFDAMIQCIQDIRSGMLKPMMAILQRYMDVVGNIVIEMSETSSFNIFKKGHLKYKMHEVQGLVANLSKELFGKEFAKECENLFKDAPVKKLDLKERYKESTTNSRDMFGFYQSQTTRTETLDCAVHFSDGKTISFHTLDEGDELNKVRDLYNENLKQLGYVDVPRIKLAS